MEVASLVIFFEFYSISYWPLDLGTATLGELLFRNLTHASSMKTPVHDGARDFGT